MQLNLLSDWSKYKTSRENVENEIFLRSSLKSPNTDENVVQSYHISYRMASIE